MGHFRRLECCRTSCIGSVVFQECATFFHVIVNALVYFEGLKDIEDAHLIRSFRPLREIKVNFIDYWEIAYMIERNLI